MNILPPPQTRGLSRACSKSYRNRTPSISKQCNQASARFSAKAHPAEVPRRDLKAENAKTRLVEREFLLSLLKNSPSKRDTKAYISRFDLPQKSEAGSKAQGGSSQTPVAASFDSWWLHKTGVNLGNLYTPARAIEESPVFSQLPLLDQATPSDTAETIHIALVKLREPQALDDETLNGIATTLSQLIRLGLNIAVVVDCDDEVGSASCGPISKEWDQKIHQHTDRVVAAIAEHNAPGCLKISDALGYSDYEQEVPSSVHVRSKVEVCNSKLLFPLLDSGIIPVLPPIASTTDFQSNRRVQADDVVLALTREFSGIKSKVDTGYALNSGDGASVTTKSLQKTPSLDRIIVLDPLGGIPSEERPDKAHVFINMEEEYDDIKKELTRSCRASTKNLTNDTDANSSETKSTFESSNPLSSFVEEELASLPKTTKTETISTAIRPVLSPRHIQNLDLFQRSLKLLPPASSGLITSPSAASISAQMDTILPKPATGVRTRRVKNALIHNLLTDKPIVSSSLPLSRFTTYFNDQSTLSDITSNHPTFIKRGIPVTMIPDPRSTPWSTPGPQGTGLSLKDPSIDFPRLLHLIEDSFGRKLDVQHYLSRIQNRVAGIIIAGEYEGGAICTWETPPNFPNSPPVPYLDKFAVLRRSQGTGGVADVVFKALLRTCFPDGCVWRSRTNNPVNKWYRERSAGSLKLPGGRWTMFWTMEGMNSMRAQGATEGSQRWADWVDVCANVAPSWADAKPPD